MLSIYLIQRSLFQSYGKAKFLLSHIGILVGRASFHPAIVVSGHGCLVLTYLR